MTRPPLLATLNGRPVAEIIDAGGQCALRYLPAVVAAEEGAYVLSASLPVRPEAYAASQGAEAFLSGLVPEGWMRDQLATNARISRDDTYALLARYGGDCAGAVSVTGPGVPTVTPDVRWLDDAALAKTIRNLRVNPLGDGADLSVRLSLGGVQEKFVAVIEGGRVGIPVGDRPSTHIMKPTPLDPDGSERFPGIAAVEHLCLELAARMAASDGNRAHGVGFTAPASDVMNVAGRDVLVIERFDRSIVNGKVLRLHAEDGCQFLGIFPTNKYEQSGDDRTPSLLRIADRLREVGADPILDLRALLQQVTLTICVGNADLHARNLTFVHDHGIRLAPVYDVVTTAVFPGVGRDLGLRVGGRYHLDDVSGEHLVEEGRAWRIGQRAVRRAVSTCCESVIAHLDDAVHAAHPERSVELFESAVNEIRSRTERIASTI